MLLISAIFLTLGHAREHHSHFLGRNYQEIFNSLPSQNQLQDQAFQKCFLKSFLTSNWTEAEDEAIPAIGIISKNLEILDECADDVSKRIKRDLDVTQIEFLIDWLYYGNSTDFLGLSIPQIPEELPILINNLFGVLGKFNGFISYIRTRLANTDYDVIIIRIQTIVRRHHKNQPGSHRHRFPNFQKICKCSNSCSQSTFGISSNWSCFCCCR